MSRDSPLSEVWANRCCRSLKMFTCGCIARCTLQSSPGEIVCSKQFKFTPLPPKYLPYFASLIYLETSVPSGKLYIS